MMRLIIWRAVHERKLNFAKLTNGRAVRLEAVPVLGFDGFRQAILDGVAAGRRVSALFGVLRPTSRS
jgi:hypothetical protein